MLSENTRNFISNKPNKIYIFPKSSLKPAAIAPSLAGVLNIEGVLLELAFWDNKSKEGLEFYGGTVKDSNGQKRRIALFHSKQKSSKSPVFFGKFYWDGVFYKCFLWNQTSQKCPSYYSGIVKVDLKMNKTNS